MKMFLIVVSSSSVDWLAHELTISLVAMAGGIIVFVGLVIEKIAEQKDEKFSPPFFKPHKCLENWGWIILMAGILVEIGVAGWSAARDDWEIRQIKINEAKNDLRKQPIAVASATVKMLVKNVAKIRDHWPSPSFFPDS